MKRTLLLSLFSLFTTLVLAQTGTVRGTLTDAANNESLIGATVRVDGSTLGAATDVNGFFSIPKVPAGKVKLILTYISYKTKEINDITVEADKVTELNTAMEGDNVQLAEVKVVASRATNTEVSVISEIKASQQVVSGISAQQIARTLDRDAAQVVRRVPGITIVGDRFINIRGLNARYNTVLLHNASTPSIETDVRSFSFDIIPSSQIDRLLVFKSPAAENPGDFAGGVVKIFTKSIPDRTSVTFDYLTTFRAGTTFGDFSQPEQGKNYWTGFNNSYQDLPASFPKQNLNTVSAATLETAGRSLRNDWTANTKSAIPDQRLALTGNFRIDAGSIRIGNITSINYSDSRTAFEIGRRDFNEFTNGQEQPIYNYNDAQNNRNIRVGILHNWAVRFNPNHTIELKNLFNQLSNSSYVNRTGQNIESNSNQNNGSFDQVYRSIYSGQLLGTHKFNKGNTEIGWVAGYNRSNRDQPDYRRFRTDVDPATGRGTLYVPVGTAAAFFLGRFSSELVENGYTGRVDLTQRFGMSNERDLELKAGIFYEDKDRTFNARNLGFVRTSRTTPEILTGTITQLFQPQNINNTTGIRIDEQTNGSDSYSATNRLRAFYGSVNIPLSAKFNVIAGLRYEANTQALKSSFNTGQPVSVSYPINRLLPSVNLTYNFSERSLLRAAYGRTLNRPEFRELAPFAYYDFDYNYVIVGSPTLQPATIDNLDLRYEFYPTPSEIISFAAFYKNFQDPIESLVVPGAGSGGAKTFTFANANSAVSAGVELEIRKGLGSLTTSPLLSRVSALFNASLIYSKVTLGGAQAVGQSDNRPLQGQSPYIVNAGINYNNPEKDFQLNLLYNVIGKRIFAVGFEGYPDIYEMPRNVVDVTFSKGLGGRFAIKGGITDILNQTNVLLQNGNGNNEYDRNNDQLIQSFRPGQTIQLGFTYQIAGFSRATPNIK